MFLSCTLCAAKNLEVEENKMDRRRIVRWRRKVVAGQHKGQAQGEFLCRQNPLYHKVKINQVKFENKSRKM